MPAIIDPKDGTESYIDMSAEQVLMHQASRMRELLQEALRLARISEEHRTEQSYDAKGRALADAQAYATELGWSGREALTEFYAIMPYAGPLGLNAYLVTFADGNTLVSTMNATLAEARACYVGQRFQFGDTEEHPGDRMIKVVRVDPAPTEEAEELKRASEHAARQVGSVHGTLTAGEAERLAELRRKIGAKWDAVNRQWEPIAD